MHTNCILCTVFQYSGFQMMNEPKNPNFLVSCTSDTMVQKTELICDASMQLGSICIPCCQTISSINCYCVKCNIHTSVICIVCKIYSAPTLLTFNIRQKSCRIPRNIFSTSFLHIFADPWPCRVVS